MKQLKLLFFVMLMSGCVSFSLNLSAQDAKSIQPTVRAAIDFGSGAVKIQMAVVDTQENRIIGKPLIAKYVPLGLIEDVATHGGRISEEMAQKALRRQLQNFDRMICVLILLTIS